jgi:ketosteroid isomerase-like protein
MINPPRFALIICGLLTCYFVGLIPVIVGKDALRKYVQASMQIPGFRITWTSTEVTFSPDGNLAYLFSRNAVTMNTPAGTPDTTAGRAITIWRRESDGEWRCAVDIWNAEPAAEQSA